MTEASDETLVESLRAHYGTAARKAAQAATAAQQCCGDAQRQPSFVAVGPHLYRRFAGLRR